MRVTLYRKGKEWKTFECEEIDITIGEVETGALFLVREAVSENGIVIDADGTMSAEFGENQISLIQPVSI